MRTLMASNGHRNISAIASGSKQKADTERSMVVEQHVFSGNQKQQTSLKRRFILNGKVTVEEIDMRAELTANLSPFDWQAASFRKSSIMSK